MSLLFRTSRLLNADLNPTGIRSLILWPSVVWRKNTGSSMKADDENFQVNMNVKQFKPCEITVKVMERKNMITVEGKHEENQRDGNVYRHFFHQYCIPEGYDVNAVSSNLTTDGVLNISAPRVKKPEDAEKIIEIKQTGKSSKADESEK